MRSLRSKILILFIFLLLMVQLVSFFFTFQANRTLESAQLNNRIENAKSVFETQFNSRRYYLSAFAETAAKDYGLKSVLSEDRKSFLVALNNHRKRINSDLAVAIDAQGNIFAQLITYQTSDGKTKVKIGEEQGQHFKLPDDLGDNTQLVELSQQLYQLSLAPIKSGARTIGWVGFGYVVNNALATDFAELTDVNISFLTGDKGKYQLIASSIEYASAEQAFFNHLDSDQQHIYNTLALGHVNQQPLVALLYKTKVDVLKNVGVEWPRLIVLIAVTVILSVIGAIVIAGSITKPIKQLVTQVDAIAHGDYNGTVEVDGSIELKQLSDEFNHMTKAIVSREETISFQAYHDALSHLPNRNALLNALIKRQNADQDFYIIHLCYLDADEINDTLGYKVGDQVVIEVAEQILKCNLHLTCFHLGAEHFVLLAEREDLALLLAKLADELNMRCHFDNIQLNLQFVMGIVDSTQATSEDVAELLQKSDIALQQAKKQQLPYQVYDPIFDKNARERLFLTNGLKQAIEHDELVLHYQPKLSLDSMVIANVEALVRWEHPEKGLIPPDAFISIAEKTGQMDALTRWVTKAAVNQYVAWRSKGLGISIAINISAENIKDTSYADYIIDLKNQHHLNDNAITLEVTEEAVVSDPKQATQVLCYLRDHGFKLSIDDYGTGYSSLAQLKQLPVQELKVDRSFVQHLATEESDKIIVLSTIELAHNMGLSVVAEGIEDQTTLSWLQSQGCELAQGYFISKPLPAKTFDSWLSNAIYKVKKYEE